MTQPSADDREQSARFGLHDAERRDQIANVRRVVIALGIAACSAPDRDREARELAALDVAEASARVRALVDSCPGFTRALDRMTRLSGRVLAGLVDDAVEAARPKCPAPLNAARGKTAAHQLARARLLEPADALAVLEVRSREPAIRLRRAELLDATRQPAAALAELATITTLDDEARALQRSLVVAVAAASGKGAEVARAIAEAPVQDRPGLANRAVAEAPPTALDALVADASLEVAVAIGDRLERERGPAAAVAARTRAAALAPDDADVHDKLALALVGAKRLDDAIAAWDRAAALVPAQPSYRIAPVRALVLADQRDRARARVAALATAARAANDPEELATASNAASAVDPALAVALAREARDHKPGDGRFVFQLAARLAEAGEVAASAATYGDLLVCGTHGRPWHRHEIAGKLIELAKDKPTAQLVIAALDAKRACAPVEPADLATYVEPARKRLAAI